MTETVAVITGEAGRSTLNAEMERRGWIGWQCQLVHYREIPSDWGGRRDICAFEPRLGLTPRGARRRAERAARRHPAWAPLLPSSR